MGFATLINYVRLARARHRHKTVRFKVGDLRAFYADLNGKDIPYVVLRWAQDVPLDGAVPQDFEHDVDHLIGRGVITAIRDSSSRLPGRAKCDFYAMTGERGTAYRRFPYLTPSLADEVLQSRELTNGVFYTPNPRDMFFAFAYHLVYHKGQKSGLEPGAETVPRYTNPTRDYQAELIRLAGIARIALPEQLTLLAVHELLKAHTWNMPFDLMVRWPDQHRVLVMLTEFERDALAPLAAITGDINVFVVRSDCVGEDALNLVRTMLKDRFICLDDRALDQSSAQQLMRLTRGGNWFEKHYDLPAAPFHVFVCRQNEVPGPLPAGMTAEKVRSRYPHLSHTDVLIKREIRAAVNAQLGGSAHRIILHATDNALESAETIAAFKGADAIAYVSRLKAEA